MAQIQYQHSHCFPSPQPLSSPSTTPGNNSRCCTIMQQQQTNDTLGKPPLQNRTTEPALPIRNSNHHSSIIGYTRVPFFTFSPASSIVPVKQTQSPNINGDGGLTCHEHFSLKHLPNNSSNNNKKNEDRLCQRIFKRDQRHGMMELVDEHNKNKKNRHPRPTALDNHHDQECDKCCNIALSIDISGQKASSFLPSTAANSNVNISTLIDSISQMADLYAVQFENILHLLEQLQQYGGRQQFKALLKKESQTIWIYFPHTLFPADQTPTIKHAYYWLKEVLAINVDDYNNWEIIETSRDFNDQKEKPEDGEFDGANYFRDIHMFLDHVDEMMGSNHLFGASSSKKNTPSRI